MAIRDNKSNTQVIYVPSIVISNVFGTGTSEAIDTIDYDNGITLSFLAFQQVVDGGIMNVTSIEQSDDGISGWNFVPNININGKVSDFTDMTVIDASLSVPIQINTLGFISTKRFLRVRAQEGGGTLAGDIELRINVNGNIELSPNLNI